MRRHAFSILELLISFGVVTVLLSILLPALESARVKSHCAQCGDQLRQLGGIWQTYLDDHDGRFPIVPVEAGWRYAGVRQSKSTGAMMLDHRRPLSRYFATSGHVEECIDWLCCPADKGITGPAEGVGTAERTAFEAFGTSYRANDALLGGAPDGNGASAIEPLVTSAIATAPSRVLLMGDPIWHEVHEQTGRAADWHDRAGHGNILLLDGSVQFTKVRPRGRTGPVVIEPVLWTERQPSPVVEEADAIDHAE